MKNKKLTIETTTCDCAWCEYLKKKYTVDIAEAEISIIYNPKYILPNKVEK